MFVRRRSGRIRSCLMESHRSRLMRAGLTATALVVSALIQSLFVAVGLASLVVAVELARIAWEKRQARLSRAALEAEMAEMPWRLVPGPGAAAQFDADRHRAGFSVTGRTM
jgi:hypothetical protein